MSKGLLIVLSAPSGSGKSTVREALMKKADFAYSVSATTRAPRDGESSEVLSVNSETIRRIAPTTIKSEIKLLKFTFIKYLPYLS